MTNVKPEHVKAALRALDDLDDPDRIKRLMHNAEEKGILEVRDAAFSKLMEILPEEKPGSFEHDAWKSIHALEELETQDRGKTIRLSRTRQKIQRDGLRKTLEDLAGAGKGTKGFDMLIERNLPELTFEAIVLKYHGEFEDSILSTARARLEQANVDVSQILPVNKEAENG